MTPALLTVLTLPRMVRDLSLNRIGPLGAFSFATMTFSLAQPSHEDPWKGSACSTQAQGLVVLAMTGRDLPMIGRHGTLRLARPFLSAVIARFGLFALISTRRVVSRSLLLDQTLTAFIMFWTVRVDSPSASF